MPKEKPKKKFTPRRRAFIANLDAHGLKSKAAVDAGYSEKSARSQANRLVNDPDVQAELDKRTLEHEKNCGITKEGVLTELKKLIYFDPRKLFKENGQPIPIQDLDEDTAKNVAGLEVKETYDFVNGEKVFDGYVMKYKLVDKLSAVDKAMRHLSLYNDKLKLDMGDRAERMAKARQRAKKK